MLGYELNVSSCFRNMSSTPTRNPLRELQIPISLSNRSPVTTVAKPSFDILEIPADDEGVENTTAEDKYSSIANLDDQLEDVKWEERTSVITSYDHFENIDAATGIIKNILDTIVLDSVTESSVDTSFGSAIRIGESDSEYESAVESIEPEAAAVQLVDEILDNIGIGMGEDMMDIVRLQEENTQDLTITYSSPIKDQPNGDDTPTPVAGPSSQFLQFQAYRGRASEEDDLTPDKRGSFHPASILATLSTPASTDKLGRRQTLVGLTDCFKKFRIDSEEGKDNEDSKDKDDSTPVFIQQQLPGAALPSRIVSATGSSSSVSTPSDVPRLLLSSPLPPVKAPTSPPPPDHQDAKRSLFDSPAVPMAADSMNEETDIVIPSKGYNLDFLDKLDDPNYNPFETKTVIDDKPDQSTTTKSITGKAENPVEIEPKKSVGKRFQKKFIPKTPVPDSRSFPIVPETSVAQPDFKVDRLSEEKISSDQLCKQRRQLCQRGSCRRMKAA